MSNKIYFMNLGTVINCNIIAIKLNLCSHFFETKAIKNNKTKRNMSNKIYFENLGTVIK